MELRQLEHFVAVAEELHFGRAASRLHIVQSGLSSSIRTLERQLGADLLVRSTRRVELTEAGRALLPEARRALSAARAAREAVDAVRGLLRGSLALGIMQAQDPLDLPGLLARFRREHPAVDVRLRQASMAVLVDSVRQGELDLAITALGVAPMAGVDVRSLSRQPLVLACPPRHRLAERPAVALGSLADEDFVDFPPGWAVRDQTDQAFAAAGVQRRIGFELNDARTLLALVAAGLGVAIVPPWAASYGLPIRLIPLDAESPPLWHLGIVTRAAAPPSPAARALLELITQA